MPNLIYTLDPAQITVTNSFAENVMKLEALGIPANNIIDIYGKTARGQHPQRR